MTELRHRQSNKPTEDRKLLMQQPYADTSFLESDAWRALRIQGEFVDGFDALARLGPAVSIFGSARTPANDPWYERARLLARRLGEQGLTVITGGGPGIMEAANRGAREASAVSVGLGIELPHETGINDYVDLGIEFRYFFVRKTMFVKYAQAFVIFPGGFGTLDELFESLTLVQTGKVEHFPIILMGTEYWRGLLEWLTDTVSEQGKIAGEDVKLLKLTDDVDRAVTWIQAAYQDELADRDLMTRASEHAAATPTAKRHEPQ
jgi:uncharacterized protein (TIGR00730 family)